MLNRKGSKITFVLPLDTGPVSVVGDFNGWDPSADPLKKRSNGTRSVTVDVGSGRHRFRYLAEGGAFFDDPDADGLEANGYGGTHSVIEVEAATPRRHRKAEKAGTRAPR
jgi:1,4-alpha-glucan branching enzyme